VPHERPELRQPRRLTDLAEYAAEYITFMRAVPENSVCDVLVEYARDYIRDVKPGAQQLRTLAAMVIDRMYRHAATLVTSGSEDRLYYAKVYGYLLDVLAFRGVRVFYVLDNEMRLDRFHLAMTLFMAAGVSVVTPYTVSDGPLPLAAVLEQLDIELFAGRHVVYIEMDATVNYLDPVMAKARTTESLAFLRNRAPEDPQVTHIPSQAVPAGDL
jgi:hypothetical protein